MKNVFHVPVALVEMVHDRQQPAVKQAHAHIFAPLSVPAIYDNRIDVTLRSKTSRTRTYPYKRADEAVN